MKLMKQKVLLSIVSASFLFFHPFIVHSETSETYLINGQLFNKEPTSTEQQLILRHGQEILTLNRDGTHWYSNSGEVIPESYSETSTVEESTIPSTENMDTSTQTQQSMESTTVSSLEEIQTRETTLNKKTVTATFSSTPTLEQSTRTNNTADTSEDQKSTSTSEATQVVSTFSATSTQKSTVPTVEGALPQSKALPNRELLPKTGSSSQQSLLLTMAGIILLFVVLIALYLETRRSKNKHSTI